MPRFLLKFVAILTMGFSSALAIATEPFTSPSETDLAIRGYSPVSYFTQKKAVRGNPEFQSKHNGMIFYFVDAEEKKLFDAEPQKYAPQFSALCTTALGGSYGNRFPADPEVFVVEKGNLYLFSSERAKKSFDTKPYEYVDKAAKLFNTPAIRGYCPVAYQMYKEARLGNPQNLVAHKDANYRLSNTEALEAFKKDVEKYLPAYGGLCADSVSQNKRHACDPTKFLVVDGKTYLFFDEDAKKRFEANPTERIQAADKYWPALKDVKPTIHP